MGGNSAAAQRLGTFTDESLDALLPPFARERSGRFWTPVDVAELAAQRLAEHRVRTVLDVGSGAGKFCVAAAAAQPGIQWHGVDRRSWLVESATALVAQLGFSNVTFAHGDVFETSWVAFEGFYFFNPFTENIWWDEDKFDTSVELTPTRYFAEIRRAEHALRALPEGAVFATYHGIGAPTPSNFELISDEAIGTSRLRLWRKTEKLEAPCVYIETDEGIFCATRQAVERFVEGREKELHGDTALAEPANDP